MTLPAFLDDVDEDEADELASMTLITRDEIKGMGQVELDVIASDCLRKMGESEAEAKALAESRDAEIARITMRYSTRIDAAKARAARYEAVVMDIASSIDWSKGKSKSRVVGFGKYGARKSAEKVEIVDADLALNFAKANNVPLAIKTKETVIHSVIAPIVLAWLHQSGEIPAGFEHHAESETYYAKVEA